MIKVTYNNIHQPELAVETLAGTATICRLSGPPRLQRVLL